MPRILITLEDFERFNTNENLMTTVVSVFVFFWIVQAVAFTLYTCVGVGEILGPYKYRVVIGRHTMNIIAMIIFSVLGFEVMESFGGYRSFSQYIDKAGHVATVNTRLYSYAAAAQRLILWQLAFETKNFCDSYIHNDGIVFLAHHSMTAILAVFGLHPFLHLYSSFFFGISEISTALICALACFDEKQGVPPLARAYPTAMKVIGVSFAVTFIIFRIILWPYVSYVFWLDMVEVIRNGTIHSMGVGITFLVANIGLSLLQVVWLGEIISEATKLLSSNPIEDKKKTS